MAKLSVFKPSTYWSIKGRLNRQRFLICNVLLWLFSLVVMIAVSALFKTGGGTVGIEFYFTSFRIEGVSAAGIIILFGWLLLALVGMLLLQVKRLHDMGYSGKYALLNLFPGATGGILLLLLFLKGEVGANKYGEDPLA